MRIDYIDGLRAIFSISTVFMHMFFALLPIAGVLHTERTTSLQIWLDDVFGGIFIFRSVAYYGVCGFFFISAIVLSYRFWNNLDHRLLTSGALRRYFRLTGPVLFSVLLAYVLMKCGWIKLHEVAIMIQSFPLTEQMYQMEPSLIAAIKEGIWGVYTSYNQPESYNAVLWTMEIELKGSFLLFAFLALFGNVKYRIILYIPLILFFIDTYYLAFVLGLFLSDITFSTTYEKIRRILYQKVWINCAVIFVGITLTSYYPNSPNSVIAGLNSPVFEQFKINPEVFYHIVGMACVMYAVLYMPILQRLLQNSLLIKWGRDYSFALYLVHVPVICSMGAAILLHFHRAGYAYGTSWLLGVTSTVPVIVFLTWATHKFIDIPSGRFAKWFEKKLLG